MAAPPGRTYRYYTGTPLYPFGYGLSYTTFTIEWHNNTRQALDAHSIAVDTGSSGTASATTMTAVVTNTGTMAGDEVLQAYFVPKNVTMRSR